jgi:hypothetical protein
MNQVTKIASANVASATCKAALVLAAIVMASVASAAGPDLSPLTSVVDFSTVVTALLAISGLLAGVYVAIRGAKIVLSMIKGG